MIAIDLKRRYHFSNWGNGPLIGLLVEDGFERCSDRKCTRRHVIILYDDEYDELDHCRRQLNDAEYCPICGSTNAACGHSILGKHPGSALYAQRGEW